MFAATCSLFLFNLFSVEIVAESCLGRIEPEQRQICTYMYRVEPTRRCSEIS